MATTPSNYPTWCADKNVIIETLEQSADIEYKYAV